MLAAGLLAGAALPLRAQELPKDFVDAATVVPGLVVDMRYAGSHNFVGAPITGYGAPRCLLTLAAASALAAVQADLKPSGLSLKVFDCYRPARAVAHFVRWARGAEGAGQKAEFYPDIDRGRLFSAGYIGARSGHSRGSTLDVTLVDAEGRALDMGTPFDFFGPKSGSGARLGGTVAANRARLREAMGRRGFAPYAKEWWHFSLRGEPYPDTYFDAPIR